MSYIPFDQLPAESRLWVFAADREISSAEASMLMAEMQSFVTNWTAHSAELTASCELKLGRFLFIAVNEKNAGASGCSIDEMMRRIRMIGETYGIEFFGMPRVQYRDNSGTVRSVLRSEFSDLATGKTVTADTIVFDNTIAVMDDLANGRWEVPARSAWHSRAFDLI